MNWVGSGRRGEREEMEGKRGGGRREERRRETVEGGGRREEGGREGCVSERNHT